MSGGQRNKQYASHAKSAEAIHVQDFLFDLADRLPETYALLRSGNLIIHSRVAGVVLHGSRGPGGHPRRDSDIDLSLLVDNLKGEDIESALQEILNTTLYRWRGAVELDLAIIFDIRNCGLKCFEHSSWSEQVCQDGGTDCFGIYKTQKGFHGLVSNAGIQVVRMYPCLKIWQRPSSKLLT